MIKYLTTGDLQSALHISRSAVFALLKRPDFPVTKIGRKLLVSETDLTEYLANGGTGDEMLMPATKK